MIEPFILSDEEKCALIDIYRYRDSTAIAESFRHQLLLRIATAAVATLYRDMPLPTAAELENYPPAGQCDPSDNPLALIFISMQSLTDEKTIKK